MEQNSKEWSWGNEAAQNLLVQKDEVNANNLEPELEESFLIKKEQEKQENSSKHAGKDNSAGENSNLPNQDDFNEALKKQVFQNCLDLNSLQFIFADFNEALGINGHHLETNLDLSNLTENKGDFNEAFGNNDQHLPTNGALPILTDPLELNEAFGNNVQHLQANGPLPILTDILGLNQAFGNNDQQLDLSKQLKLKTYFSRG